MLIWINGAFGSGKTQTAFELQRRIDGSYVYDPENAGFFIRSNIPPEMNNPDFQDHHLWRDFNRSMIEYIADNYCGTIIIPMTVTNPSYCNEIIGKLSEKYDIKHFILCAEKETIIKRLSSRLEGKKSWAAMQIDRCINAFSSGDIHGIKIQTDNMNIYQVAERIAQLSDIRLNADSRSRLRKLWDRTITKFRHIR